MVEQFEEVHQGQKQDVLMRVVRQERTALERQVWEFVVIDCLAAKTPKASLNHKIEWGLSKKPSLIT